MDYRLEFFDYEDCLHIKVQGTWNNRNSRQIMNDVGAAFSASAHERILIDNLELETEAEPGSDYFDAEFGAKVFARTKHRVALVVREEQVEIDRFFVDVLANRGVNIRLFDNLRQAHDWLTSDPSAGRTD